MLGSCPVLLLWLSVKTYILQIIEGWDEGGLRVTVKAAEWMKTFARPPGRRPVKEVSFPMPTITILTVIIYCSTWETFSKKRLPLLSY